MILLQATLQRAAGNEGVAQQLEADLEIMNNLHLNYLKEQAAAAILEEDDDEVLD